ncbi:MAG: 4Fe-4S dicluster domain-containing protein, partial [Vicinamibacteria bacterium]
AASFLNAQRLKGIHMAIKAGMLAAETILEALGRGDTSEAALSGFRDRVEASWAKKELWKVRNFHQSFKWGFLPGLLNAGLQLVTGGRGIIDPIRVDEDHKYMKKLREAGSPVEKIPPGEKLFFDKVTDVFSSGTVHELNQPAHLLVADLDVCNTRCVEEFGNPCEHFCPAQVYEMITDESARKKRLVIHAENCVHCKTCDIADPYGIITWVPPEGGGGPNYQNL